ncbi:multiple myeloma tumor-associated protein 2 [Struthio camelus]|uniref:multiple myeloma tumor-associated protein 2 n=1 Tax=Struthio camelus TaxID=8801 RepID=UPI003603C0CC
MFGSSRGGVRGGQDQFSWEDVKVDKQRENYLGNSLMAPVGRWQKGKDLTWYAKGKAAAAASGAAREEELAAVRLAEREAMLAALGYGTARRQRPAGLSKEDLAEVCKRGGGERSRQDVDRLVGLGSSSGSAGRLTLSKEDREAAKMGLSVFTHQKVPSSPETSGSKRKQDKEEKAEEPGSESGKKSKKEKKKKKKKKKRKKEKKKDKRPERDAAASSSPSSPEQDARRRRGKARHRPAAEPSPRSRSRSRHDTDSSSSGHSSPASPWRRRSRDGRGQHPSPRRRARKRSRSRSPPPRSLGAPKQTAVRPERS